MCAKSLQLCPTLYKPMHHSLPRLLCPWNSPGKDTRVGCPAILQRICCALLWLDRTCISFMSPALAGGIFTASVTWDAWNNKYFLLKYINLYKASFRRKLSEWKTINKYIKLIVAVKKVWNKIPFNFFFQNYSVNNSFRQCIIYF